jgi:predicted ATPase
MPSEEIQWEDATKISIYDKQFHSSLKYLREKLLNEKSELVLQTSAEQQSYQKYLDDLKEWNDRQTSLLGDSRTEHTITYYETILDYIKLELKNDLAALDNKRLECIQSIYDNYKYVSAVLADLYAPVKRKLENILDSQDESIDFSADVVAEKNLASEISQKINKKSKGLFRGIAETNAFFDELIRSTNFNEFESFKTFFNNIVNAVRDKNFEQITKVIPDRADFYRFLSEMRYISAEYTLKLGNKTISEMSPGERGMVLLVFYLALSKDNIPLIIDQPEDNLDNQSVYNKLVPCIIEAKKNRQVIIVTHNPNIAIASDAEQIVYCSIDKSKTKISYLAGSIENQEIRNKTIDVLEGTEPAFDLRKSKYFYSFLQKL